MDIKPILTLSRYYLIGLSCCTFFDKLLFFKYEKPLFWWTVLGVNKFKSRGSLWMQQRRIIIIMRTIQTILVFHFQLIKFWTTFCDREEIFDGIMDSWQMANLGLCAYLVCVANFHQKVTYIPCCISFWNLSNVTKTIKLNQSQSM